MLKKLAVLSIFSSFILISCVNKDLKGQRWISSNSQGVPQLTILNGDNPARVYTTEDLLKSPLLKKLTVKVDPAYGGTEMIYDAIPLAPLFQGLTINPTDTLLFSCLDGFSAPISMKRVLNRDTKKAIAYIAIEHSQKWPAIKGGKSPGPFYLVWENPELSKIKTEEWPFQLAAFEVKPSLEKQFPLTVPKASVNSAIYNGYKAFMQNCFTCHTLNGQGASQMGPDLNMPYGPTDYFKKDYFKKLIRNPQDLRHWPQAKMQGVAAKDLSNQELNNLIAYFQHMSQIRPKAR